MYCTDKDKRCQQNIRSSLDNWAQGLIQLKKTKKKVHLQIMEDKTAFWTYRWNLQPTKCDPVPEKVPNWCAQTMQKSWNHDFGIFQTSYELQQNWQPKKVGRITKIDKEKWYETFIFSIPMTYRYISNVWMNFNTVRFGATKNWE